MVFYVSDGNLRLNSLMHLNGLDEAKWAENVHLVHMGRPSPISVLESAMSIGWVDKEAMTLSKARMCFVTERYNRDTERCEPCSEAPDVGKPAVGVPGTDDQCMSCSDVSNRAPHHWRESL